MSSFNDSIASMSQDFDFQANSPSTSVARGRSVTLASMRGVINLFNHYFKQTDQLGNKKKMTRVEKNRRWISYKQKIWDDYGRRITGTYASEQALIRRYSDPLTFLKYKLKRARNLRVTDLSPADQAYYKEIGGLEDVNELIKHTRNNVDSIGSFSQPPAKRPRIDNVYTGGIDFRRNHNVHSPNVSQINQYSPNQQRNYPHIIRINDIANDVIPPSTTTSPTTNKQTKPKPEIDAAIDQLAGDMDIFEQEQLLKKKIEAYEMTQEKVKALMNAVKSLLSNEPQMVGTIPGLGCLDDQLILFFDFWINQNKGVILSNVSSESTFFEQLTLLRSDGPEFTNFLHKWKLYRILKNDSFLTIWKWMVDELNIELKVEKAEDDVEDE